jgi:hypothetical protein
MTSAVGVLSIMTPVSCLNIVLIEPFKAQFSFFLNKNASH